MEENPSPKCKDALSAKEAPKLQITAEWESVQ